MINTKLKLFLYTLLSMLSSNTSYKFKNTKDLFKFFFGVLVHIKAHYGCYEIAKNDKLHIHTLLWFNEFPNPNTLI